MGFNVSYLFNFLWKDSILTYGYCGLNQIFTIFP